MSVLDEIVKAYDIRGTVPDQLNAEVAHALGVAFARFAGADRGARRHATCADPAPELVDAFSRGVMEQGVDVVDLGLASTDLLYYAAGTLDAPGAMFTASHNPAQYNGVKLCLSGARPVGIDTGLGEVKRVAESVLDGARSGSCRHGRVADTAQACLDAFVDHVVSFIDVGVDAPAARRRRHRQRDGRARRPGRVRAAAA